MTEILARAAARNAIDERGIIFRNSVAIQITSSDARQIPDPNFVASIMVK